MNFIELYFKHPEKPEPFVPNKMDCFSPACPICGGELRKWNRPRGARLGRSHSFFAKPQLWICPAAKAEIVKDERGHLSVTASAKHERPSRLWSDEELVRVAVEESAKRESERIARGEDECPF